MLMLEQIVTGDSQYKDGTGDIACRDSVDKFNLGYRVKNHFAEAGHFHAHRVGVKACSHRKLHPAVGNQNPQRREIRANGNQPGCH